MELVDVRLFVRLLFGAICGSLYVWLVVCVDYCFYYNCSWLYDDYVCGEGVNTMVGQTIGPIYCVGFKTQRVVVNM